jgi:alpha-galactosidase
MKTSCAVFICFAMLGTILAIDNGLGKTPPMGWNSWNHFDCNISETIVKATADRIVELGLDKKGYVYVNLDDCWQIARDNTTKVIIEDKKNFPSGMGALAKYVHDKGLKFGLYSDAGTNTCQGRPGSYGF